MAFLCFGGSCVCAHRESDGAGGGDTSGRWLFAYKVICCIALLGCCARALVHVAWYDSVWLQDEVTRAVGLGGGGGGGGGPVSLL